LYCPSTSSQEPLNQIQPNLAASIIGGWGYRFVKIKGHGHQNIKENKGGKFGKYLKIFFLGTISAKALIFHIKHPWDMDINFVHIMTLGL